MDRGAKPDASTLTAGQLCTDRVLLKTGVDGAAPEQPPWSSWSMSA